MEIEFEKCTLQTATAVREVGALEPMETMWAEPVEDK